MGTGKVKAHFDDEAPEYDELIVKLIPGYHEQHDVILGVLPFEPDAAIRVLDLGAGTGALSRLVLEAFPNSSVEATDISEGMLSECRANLAAYADRVSHLQLDFASGELGSGYDLVVSGLAVHHIDDDAKRSLFARVFEALVPGGAFVMREIVTAETAEESEALSTSWREFMDAAGADGERWYRQSLDEDRPASLANQLRWLEEAGFGDVSCHWQRINFVVFGGRRPL